VIVLDCPLLPVRRFVVAVIVAGLPPPPDWLNEIVTPSVPPEDRGFHTDFIGDHLTMLDNHWLHLKLPSVSGR